MFKNSLFKKVQVICLSNVLGQVIKSFEQKISALFLVYTSATQDHFSAWCYAGV